MKDIRTLIPNIYKLVGRKDGWFTEELARELSGEITSRLREHFGREDRTPTLRLSQMGPRCPKALWHSIHTPELAEPLPATAMIKFAYGHILEAMIISLAKAAGHEVQGEQDAVSVLGVQGHRDCIIDGYLVDVKSCSSLSFKKFENKTLALDDTFGYLDQLDGYLVGSAEDDLLEYKDVAFDLAIDKTLGKMVLYEHSLRKDHILKRVAAYKSVIALDAPPACTCEEIPDGESGNYKLGVNGSYSPFKYVCKPGLRTFLYAGGVRFLTRVVKRPTYKGEPIKEVDKQGRRVYN